MAQWIVLCQQVVGGGGSEFGIVYNFDHEYFTTKAKAIKHGFRIRGSDDFNVATVEGGKVTRLYWMDEEMSDVHDLQLINEQLAFSSDIEERR
jgi:hypothetical protein